jgi:hypothetical protein
MRKLIALRFDLYFDLYFDFLGHGFASRLLFLRSSVRMPPAVMM